MSKLIIPDSCDTMVALPNTTRSGHTIFAKNNKNGKRAR